MDPDQVKAFRIGLVAFFITNIYIAFWIRFRITGLVTFFIINILTALWKRLPEENSETTIRNRVCRAPVAFLMGRHAGF